MEYESLITLSYIAAAASVVFFTVGAVLFFKLKISDAIGELSGSKQRKAIENIKANNNSNVKKSLSTGSAVFENKTNSSTVSKKKTTSNIVEGNIQNTDSSLVDLNNAADDDGVTEVLGISVSEEVEEAETSVLGIQTVNEDSDDENVTTVLGAQNIADDEDENVTSVLGVQPTDENQGDEDGITFVHGKTIK